MKISLIGYMGSGKSTIGKGLAAESGLNFIDLDHFIETENRQTISGLFSHYGEIKFRKIEREALTKILSNENSFVLSLGGGTPVYYNNIELINEKSFSVYLRLPVGEIVSRLVNEKHKRPLIAHLTNEQLPEFIAKHLFERRNYYEQAHLSIDANGKSTEEIVSEIIQHLPRPR